MFNTILDLHLYLIEAVALFRKTIAFIRLIGQIWSKRILRLVGSLWQENVPENTRDKQGGRPRRLQGAH